jgi:hypothetical protein
MAVSVLVHAILNSADVARCEGVSCREARPLEFLDETPLAAAYSQLPRANAEARVAELLAYAQGIHELFQQVTVLPMRYGCWLDTLQELRPWLCRHRSGLQACLAQVEGCVEMSTRIIPAAGRGEPPSRNSLASLPHATAVSASSGPGASYLRARRQRFEQRDGQKDAFEQTMRRFRTALAGLYVKSVAEQHSAMPAGCWSLHFLVPRPQCEAFRRALGDLAAAAPEKLLLTGPWPPYNFADYKVPGC